MLEDILYRINGLVPSGAEFGNVPPEQLPLAVVCCVLGALILTRFTGSLGSLTVPVNWSALFIGVITANWALSGLDMPVDKFVAQPVIISLIGMTIASFLMMGWLKRDGWQT